MKKEITRRGFLGECGKGIGAGLAALVLGSCATLDNNQTSKSPINLTEEQREAYKEYKQKYGRLDESNLTAEQREYLKQFNDYSIKEGINDSDKEWVNENYPFINFQNTEDLPVRDKVFLMEKAYEKIESIIEGAASVTY